MIEAVSASIKITRKTGFVESGYIREPIQKTSGMDRSFRIFCQQLAINDTMILLVRIEKEEREKEHVIQINRLRSG